MKRVFAWPRDVASNGGLIAPSFTLPMVEESPRTTARGYRANPGIFRVRLPCRPDSDVSGPRLECVAEAEMITTNPASCPSPSTVVASSGRLVILTDVDGVLCDPGTCSVADARAALEVLGARNVPVVLCSERSAE